MKHKVLKMKSLKYISEGALGSYYRIGKSQVGIKIQYFGFSTKQAALDCIRSLARREYKNLVEAAKRTRMVPRAKGLAIVEEHDSYYGKQYHAGYMMTHIKGQPLGDQYIPDKLWRQFERASDRMEALGIQLDDNHNYNVMKSGKRIIFIDAARFFIKPIRKKRKTKKRRK